MLHPPIRTIYQIRDVTWPKHIYYQKELNKYNSDLLPWTQEDYNKNDEQDDGDKVEITDNDVNESDSEEKIMSEYVGTDHAVIDRESANQKTTPRSGRVAIPPARPKYYKTGVTSLDRYGKAVTLTTTVDKFYSQIKELNELQLFSKMAYHALRNLRLNMRQY